MDTTTRDALEGARLKRAASFLNPYIKGVILRDYDESDRKYYTCSVESALMAVDAALTSLSADTQGVVSKEELVSHLTAVRELLPYAMARSTEATARTWNAGVEQVVATNLRLIDSMDGSPDGIVLEGRFKSSTPAEPDTDMVEKVMAQWRAEASRFGTYSSFLEDRFRSCIEPLLRKSPSVSLMNGLTVDQVMEAVQVWADDEFDSPSMTQGEIDRLRFRVQAFANSLITPEP